MSDRITLTGLRATGRHGVYDFERAQGQEFVVDVTLELDLALAARSDDVADTVHYGELASRLVEIVTGEPVDLIETLAQRLADACLADTRVRTATVTVHKPQAPIPHEFVDVSVTLTRHNQPPGDPPEGPRPAGDLPRDDGTAGDPSPGDRSRGDQRAGDRSRAEQPAGDRPAGEPT